MKPKDDRSTKGILRADKGRTKFRLSRYEPADALRPYVQHYWLTEWDLRGEPPYPQGILSHPNVNLIFEPEQTRVYGIWEKVSTKWLREQGWAFAVKFNPAGFYPFWKRPVSRLTGKSIGLAEAFGGDVGSIEADILNAEDVAAKVTAIDRFLLARLPERDANVDLLNEMVADLAANRDILRVEQLAERYGKSARTLQRLFERYVGVSPKGVIQRFRLHEAAERLEKGEAMDLAALSQDMGYYDQAHFIKDFKSFVGTSPEAYLRANR